MQRRPIERAARASYGERTVSRPRPGTQGPGEVACKIRYRHLDSPGGSTVGCHLYMKPQNKNPKIAALAQSIGYLAGYANDKKENDHLYGVIVWAVMRWPDKSPDEVVGQVFNGQYITEADAMADEEGVGSFIGYFTDDKEGRRNFEEAANVWRAAGGSSAEGEDGEDEEGEDEEGEDEDDEEDEDEDDEEGDDEEEEED